MLFIDTETTGIPQNWEAPYEHDAAWPHSVQVAWAVYTRDGQQVKAANYYVRNDGFEISDTARMIHGITDEFLLQHGEDRKVVFEQLAADLQQYEPLVVGHFMELDYHMAGVGFFRSGLENPLLHLPRFCTMDASVTFLLYHNHKYLRLGELYERLFNKPMGSQHNALADAEATASCFFELVQRGDITDKTILAQQSKRQRKVSSRNNGCGLPVLFVSCILILLIFWL
nr:3'-5' exonuclease [Pontibacter liquoris]